MRSGRWYINGNWLSSVSEACEKAPTEVKVISGREREAVRRSGSIVRVRASSRAGQASTRVLSRRTPLVSAQAGKMGEAEVHIVHVEKGDTPLDEVEAKHLEVLSSVCGGSHEKAKELLVYQYKHGMRGFSAKLTPEQVEELSKKPGVLAVNKQGVAHLHGGAATTGAQSGV